VITSDVRYLRNSGSLKLVVLSLRTGLLHPASSGLFEVAINVLGDGYDQDMSWSTLYHNLLLYDLSGHGSEGELVVVNWMSGIAQTVRISPSPRAKSSLSRNMYRKSYVVAKISPTIKPCLIRRYL
jgi:hypothetical protein